MATKLTDGRWKASWVDPSGKRRTYHSRISAEDAERLKEADRAKTEGFTPSIGETMHDLAKALWWPSVETLRPNTVRRYADLYARHIRPVFGHLRPTEIKHAQVQGWANDMVKRGVSAASITLYTSQLSAIFKACIREGICTVNPATGVKKPTIKRRKRVMTVGDCRNLLSMVDGTELAAPVFLGGVLGLRRGELCGLKWANIDASTRRVSIVEQRLIRQGIKGKKIGEGPVKRESSERSFVLPPVLWEQLLRVGDQDSAYVCTTDKGRPWNPEHLTGLWASRRDSLGFAGWHFHDLRHGAGGILAALGIDLLTIAAILGHANINTSQLYASVQDARATHGLKKVGAALFKKVDKR